MKKQEIYILLGIGALLLLVLLRLLWKENMYNNLQLPHSIDLTGLKYGYIGKEVSDENRGPNAPKPGKEEKNIKYGPR